MAQCRRFAPVGKSTGGRNTKAFIVRISRLRYRVGTTATKYIDTSHFGKKIRRLVHYLS